MDREVNFLLGIIEDALDLVEESYFNLRTTYELKGIVRERVFCYELYYRMRCVLQGKEETDLVINGEIDKRGHIGFKREDRRNPDFVFHIPGCMERNSVVVEVKGRAKGAYTDKCIKDFETLILFVSKYNYKGGVFLLYNYLEMPIQLQQLLYNKYADILNEEVSKKIWIICKKYGYKVQRTSLYDVLKG